VRQQLSKSGANEVLTYSFVHGDILKKTNIEPDKWSYHLRNAISPDLQYYRPALMPSLLAKVNAQIFDLGRVMTTTFLPIYELGKAHVKDHFDDIEDNLPKQMRRLGLRVGCRQKNFS
jgi:phenylalanyl-tRNA synthetase beta chain